MSKWLRVRITPIFLLIFAATAFIPWRYPITDCHASQELRGLLTKLTSRGKQDNLERSFLIKDDRSAQHSVTIGIPADHRDDTGKHFGYSLKDLNLELTLEAEQFNRRNAPRCRITSVSHQKGFSFQYQNGYERLSGEFRKQVDLAVRNYFQRQHFKYEQNVISVNYPAVQEWQAPYLTDLYGQMLQIARNDGMKDRDFIALLVNFVQQLRYKMPPDAMGDIKTCGFWPPVTCLLERAGDCDSKSTLFATLYGHYQRNGSIMVMTEKHAFVGIRDQHRILPRDRVISRGGRDYLLVEMTNPHPMGVISNKDWDQVSMNRVKYVNFH